MFSYFAVIMNVQASTGRFSTLVVCVAFLRATASTARYCWGAY